LDAFKLKLGVPVDEGLEELDAGLAQAQKMTTTNAVRATGMMPFLEIIMTSSFTSFCPYDKYL
jgi:hypothetical protein